MVLNDVINYLSKETYQKFYGVKNDNYMRKIQILQLNEFDIPHIEKTK